MSFPTCRLRPARGRLAAGVTGGRQRPTGGSGCEPAALPLRARTLRPEMRVVLCLSRNQIRFEIRTERVVLKVLCSGFGS